MTPDEMLDIVVRVLMGYVCGGIILIAAITAWPLAIEVWRAIAGVVLLAWEALTEARDGRDE